MSSSTSWPSWKPLSHRFQFTLQDQNAGVGFVHRDGHSRKNSEKQTPAVNQQSTTNMSSSPIAVKMLVFNGPDTSRKRLQPTKKIKSISFPNRNSSYIGHIKSQKRVQSALTKSIDTQSEELVERKRRTRTKSAFPVTKLSNNSPTDFRTDSHKTIPILCQPISEIGGLQKHKSKPNDVFKFDDRKAASIPKIHNQRKYVIQETDNATMYIDKGKVIYFRKSRHNTYNLLKNLPTGVSVGGFLYDIKKDYMTQSKYGFKCLPCRTPVHQCENESNGHCVSRSEYHEDGAKRGFTPAIVTACSENQNIDLSLNAKQAPVHLNQQHANKNKKMFFLPKHTLTESPSQSSPFFNEDVRPYSQSRISERQFYLQTPQRQPIPGTKQYIEEELETCKCSLCRLEMQLAIIATIEKDGSSIQKLTRVNTFDDNLPKENVEPYKEDKNMVDQTDTEQRQMRRERYRSMERVKSQTSGSVTIAMPRIDLLNQL